MTQVVIDFIRILGEVLVFAILGRALMSWIMPNDSSGLSRILADITEPILGPVRRVIRPVGGIDFSPIVAMVVIQLVGGVLVQIIGQSG